MKVKKNAIEEANDIFYKKILVPKSYVDAFYYSQKFEFYLKWILTEYIVRVESLLAKQRIFYKPEIEDLGNRACLKRIKTFLPIKENQNFYIKVNRAIKKRNTFIHFCFMPKGFNLDIDAYYLNENSLINLKDWINSYLEAEPVILSVLKKAMSIPQPSL